MKFSFNAYKQINLPNVYLAYPNKKLICKLNAMDRKSSLFVNGISNFSFKTYQYKDKKPNNGYDKISIGKYIYVDSLGWYRIIKIDRTDDGYNSYYEISASDLSIELCQTRLTSFGSMGTENDAQGGLDRYALYDTNDQEHSIAHIFIAKNPGWSFKYIDPAISKNRRSFNNDSISSYKFLTEDVAEAFECVFTFEINDRTISVYKVENLGKETPYVFSFRNLIKQININWSEDDIKTMLYVTGGNDASGTALSIAGVNPSGNGYITNFSYFYEDMSIELRDKLNEYYQLMENNKEPLATTLSQLNTLQNELNELNNKMPSDESSTDWTQYGLVGLKAKSSQYLNNMSVLTDKLSSDQTAAQMYNNYNTLWEQVNTQIAVRESQIEGKNSQISDKKLQIRSYTVNIQVVLGDELYKELQPYIREDDLCDDSYIATTTMTESEVLEMKQDLYEHGVSELERVCYPQFEMTVNSVNFPVLFKYKEWTENIELGDIIRIKYSDDAFIKARLLKMDISWDNLKDFSLTFSSKTSLENGLFEFAEMQNLINRSATTLKYKTSGWNEASKQATEAFSTTTQEFLDLSLQQIMSNGNNQDVTINDSGILMKKWLKDSNKYDDEKLWITNRQILLFEEPDGTNLKTPKVAIGKVYKLVNGVLKSFYGVGAEVVVGDMFFGESLTIQNKNNTLTMDNNGLTATATNGFKVQINPDNPNSIFSVSENSNQLLYVDATLKKLVFKGRAEIDEGKIGGWTITSNMLYSGLVGMSSDTTVGANVFWAGSVDPSSAPFRVNNQGKLIASGADITGKVTADSGKIGGWTIDGNSLVGSSASYIRGGRININNNFFYAGDDEIYLGDFYTTYTNRALFMSTDQYSGMSARASSRNFSIWGGYRGGGASSISNYVFAVDGNYVYAKEIKITGDSYWKGWTLTDTIEWLDDRISALE